MSIVNNEIQQLQLRILELEKQKKKKEEEEILKKESLEHNFQIINNELNKKQNSIKNNTYSKSVPLARFYDEELVRHLEATYNILQILNNRIKDLENK
jgi:hypothetical protein